ncbi:cytochrome P450 [Jatrophihabitans telluris]|uniref:Cytochrome P450 n=1 Tax=Jatrophihabitans telluris TaxID=2038343 RepID=A0ABY4QV61_9ACTN|nr:cytochrome P450 [Jatrophihabitans telluris]UQX86859.1 cytochrome P450 [Jatrophihabitans telluris]
MRDYPAPHAQRLVGHLGRWGTDPLGLIEEGSRLGSVFSLRLWRSAVVGYSPDWNRLILGDLSTFRSRGSMSGLSPYLAGGLVRTEAPEHRRRRQVLNPSFHRTALADLEPRIRAITRDRLPRGDFDATAWSSALVRDVLSALFFDDTIPAALLQRFLAPLDRALPAPFLRRPWLFRRMNRALGHALAHAGPTTLAGAFSALPGGIEEARVALAAAYDTTAHTLAWLLWHLAEHPSFATPDRVPLLVEETLRLYPAGWMGTRITATPVTFDDVVIPSGTLVMYSPYLTHRDPTLWTDPTVFRPDRFSDPVPAWGFIPFAAGERTCLGAQLARLMLRTVAAEFADLSLTRTGPHPGLRAGITLTAAGPLALRCDGNPLATKGLLNSRAHGPIGFPASS